MDPHYRDSKREKMKNYLLECSHYEKDRLIRGAKNRGFFSDSESNEDVYNALENFAKFHGIKLHEKPVMVAKVENTFIEKIDEDGESQLVPMLDPEDLQKPDDMLKTLYDERDRLSEKLLIINNLIKAYEK